LKPILDVQNLSAAYGPVPVLKRVNLQVGAFGITALLGANGAGKTTMLRAICNTMVQVSGEIFLDGRRIDNWNTEDIIRLGVAHVPDGRGTFKDLSVEENLWLGAHTRKSNAEIRSDFERVYGYFPKLRERRKQQAGTMSGGEQQMLAVSRALMSRPRLLLLDEPSFGLAPILVQEIFRILQAINERDRVSMLLVEQNANMALRLATDAYLIETGEIVMSGLASMIAADEGVRRSYLGY
jgi:branched-chain amino acid transport system ATP-binding protein